MARFILDSRNQDDSFVQLALEKLGHKCDRDFKLAFGDIAENGDMFTCIDFKSSGGGLPELIRNVCSKDHERLKREINKVVEKGGRLVFLCFEPNINCIEDILNWKAPTFKSTSYKTSWYEKESGKKVTKAQVNAAFTRAWKNGSIAMWGDYTQCLRNFVNNFYICKKELAHTKGTSFTQVKMETFVKALKTMSKQDHYGKGVKIDFEFTTKEDCGKKIIEIFERLKKEKTKV